MCSEDFYKQKNGLCEFISEYERVKLLKSLRFYLNYNKLKLATTDISKYKELYSNYYIELKNVIDSDSRIIDFTDTDLDIMIVDEIIKRRNESINANNSDVSINEIYSAIKAIVNKCVEPEFINKIRINKFMYTEYVNTIPIYKGWR